MRPVDSCPSCTLLKLEITVCMVAIGRLELPFMHTLHSSSSNSNSLQLECSTSMGGLSEAPVQQLLLCSLPRFVLNRSAY